MKTNAIVRIILFSVCIFILVGILLSGLGLHLFSATFHSETSPYTEAQVIESAQIRTIEIEWAAGNILIEPNDTSDTITVEEAVSDADYQMLCKVNGSTLSIYYAKPHFGTINLGVDGEAKDLHITFPADWSCDSLGLDVAAANVIIRDLTIGELDFDGASGFCSLESCHVTDVDVDAASGDLTFYGTLENLDFDGASADCKLVLDNCPKRIDLDGMSGKLDITLPSDCGFTAKTNGLSCDFSTDFQTTSQGGTHRHGDGSCLIEIDALSGKVIIHDGGYTCHDGQKSHHNGHH